MQVTSTLQAQSALDKPIVHLTIVVMAIMFAILVLVSVLVVTASIRFRYRAGRPEPEQNFGNHKLEFTWTILPFLLLVGIFVLTVITMNASDPATTDASGGDPPPDLIITGHQFWWEAEYPAANVITANEIHLPPANACWFCSNRRT